MIGRRAVLGLSLLCALGICAFAAPSASAKGTTLVTCVEGGTKDFSDSHCKSPVTPGSGQFGHEVISGSTTNLRATNTITVNKEGKEEISTAIFKSTAAGFALEITCTELVTEGTATNEEVGGVMQNVGSELVSKFTKCTVPKPVGQNCKIKGEGIEIPSAKSTTYESGEEMGVEFTPTIGSTFAEVTLEGCKMAGLNKTYPLGGSTRGTPSGATLNFTATSTKGLTFGGQAATFENVQTWRMNFWIFASNPVAYTTTVP